MKRQPVEHEHKFKRLRLSVAVLTFLLGIILIVIHWVQHDILAAVTLIPPWLWFIPGIVGLVVSARIAPGKLTLLTVGIWLVFGYLFVEEAGSIARGLTNQQSDSGSTIRVITLNSCFGSVEAIQETAQQSPDILLIQESPGDNSLNKLCREILGEDSGWISCGDPSILAKGNVRAIVSDPKSHFAHAVVKLPNGTSLDVVSLRLSPPVFRMDFWDSGFWIDHQSTRQKHRKQLRQIRSHLAKHAETELLVVGGDFNLVGGDGALDAFTGGANGWLSDTFYASGIGWCGSGTNDYPLFRVDQIWTSDRMTPRSNKTIKSSDSDHRMVLVELDIN